MSAVIDPGCVRDWSVFKEFENTYIDYNIENNFSRFYNGKTFVGQTLKFFPENLTYGHVHIKNVDQVIPPCYAKFAVLLTKNLIHLFNTTQHYAGTPI